MSSQSMKYYELPSFKMLSAYKKGNLSAQDRNWVAQTLQHNAVVQAVAESVDTLDGSAVKAISQRTEKALIGQYMKVGFWSKYGIWIGLSSIVLLVGLFYIFQGNTPQEYAKTDFAVGITKVSGEKTTAPLPENNPTPSTNTAPVVATNKVADAQETKTEKESLPNKTTGGKLTSTPSKNAQESPNKGKKQLTPPAQPTKPEKTKKAGFSPSKNDANIPHKSSKIMLAIKRVQVLSKQFANERSSSHKRKGNAPMRTSQNQKGSRSAKAFADLPKYPGGDEALTRYFVGKLHPVQIPREQSKKYDRAVRLDLTIKGNGKLDKYKVFGHLNPIHQKELEKAIKELPRFSRGSGSTVYSLGISF